MKIGVFVFLILLSSSFIPSEENLFLIHRFIVQPDSQLIIDGKTNVNSFRCSINRYPGKDTLVLQEGGPLRRPVFLKGSVALPASHFDCGLRVMTSDFSTTIKAKDHPYIVINFKTFERLPNYKLDEDKFKGTMTISLGGASKVFDIDCIIEAKSSGFIHLRGSRKFLFSDFHLVPPEKMMGLIRIEQELTVIFNLVLRLDTNA